MTIGDDRISDEQLRLHHDFVHAFENIRKRFGLREMDDAALHQIAGFLDCSFSDLRMARSLRNAIAHADPASPDRIKHCLSLLQPQDATEPEPEPAVRSEVSVMRMAYRIHAWQDDQLERLMLANGFVSVGGDEIDNLERITDPEEIRRRLEISMPDRTPQAIGIFIGYWKRFLWEAIAGDVVVIPTRRHEVAIGEFTGPYRYVADAEPHARHRRAVDWHADDVDKSDLPEDLSKVLSGRHTIQTFKTPDAASRLLAIADGHVRPQAGDRR